VFYPLALGAACTRIRLLGALKKQLDKFETENKQFKKMNTQLKTSVNDLNEQNGELIAANKRLETSIDGLDQVREAMEQFAAENQSDVSTMMTNLQNSIQEQKTVQKQTIQIQERTKKLTEVQERTMLMNLFMQFQNEDGSRGLSKDEFETVLDMVPEGSCARLRKNKADLFKEFDTDGDGTVSIKNFRNWLTNAAGDLE